MQLIEKEKSISLLGSAVIKTLLYHDIFKYPLTSEEIYRKISIETNRKELEATLNILVTKGLIKKKENFYFVNEDDNLPEKRRKENKLAQKYLRYAKWIGKFISFFPFVRGVYLSGSISKQVMNKDSDIDFFIITSKDRLWVCRMLLVLFKKIFLLNFKKFFCLNYFIDENNLEIKDKDLFTAMEIVTLIPVYGNDIYRKFLIENEWVYLYFPNFSPSFNGFFASISFKKMVELMLVGSLGNFLENKTKEITINHWNKKFKKRDIDQTRTPYTVDDGVCGIHPNNLRFKILDLYQAKIFDFENKNKIMLSPILAHIKENTA